MQRAEYRQNRQQISISTLTMLAKLVGDAALCFIEHQQQLMLTPWTYNLHQGYLGQLAAIFWSAREQESIRSYKFNLHHAL